jgi:hypothetical protein
MLPTSVDEYLHKSEHAVRHLYAGLESCWAHYEEATRYWDISKAGSPLTTVEELEALQEYLKHAKRYLDLTLSEATFAGAILQVAATGIRRLSRNDTVPHSCGSIILNKKGEVIEAVLPFCIGREVYGLPAGLIVYAARNQYNHWDDDQPHFLTQRILGVMSAAVRCDPWNDLAFNHGDFGPGILATGMLFTALRWTDYARYEADMRSMLLESARDQPRPAGRSARR